MGKIPCRQRRGLCRAFGVLGGITHRLWAVPSLGITRRLGVTLFVKRAWGLCYAGVFEELGVVAVFVFVFAVGEDVAEDSGYEECAVCY